MKEDTSIHQKMDSLINNLSGLGLPNDKGRSGEPDIHARRLTNMQLLALWKHNGLARRVVSLIPKDATKKGVRCSVEGEDGDPIREHLESLGALLAIRHAWTWGRLYGGSILYMVTSNDDDLTQELVSGEVVNLLVFDATEISVAKWGDDARSNCFCKPELWRISPSSESEIVVHHSRVIYFGGDIVPPSRSRERDGIDESILLSSWEQIRNKTSSEQALSSIIQESSVGVMRILGLAQQVASKGAAIFKERMKLIAIGKSLNNTVLMAEGETYSRVATPVAGLAEIDSRLAFALASVTGIPMTKLYGDAPGGLSTDGEAGKQNWRDSISAEQDQYLIPAIKRIAFVHLGVEVTVIANPLDEPSEEQRALIMKTTAEADAIYLQNQVISPDEVRQTRFLDKSSGQISVKDMEGSDQFEEQVKLILGKKE